MLVMTCNDEADPHTLTSHDQRHVFICLKSSSDLATPGSISTDEVAGPKLALSHATQASHHHDQAAQYAKKRAPSMQFLRCILLAHKLQI